MTVKEYEQSFEDTQSGKFLTFSLDGDEFGIEIRHVTEIIGMQPITELPEVPDYIKGIINLRGKIIPLIDMRIKFKKAKADYTGRTCIIVIDIFDFSVGLIVDSVSEVMAIDDENISPPLDSRTGIENKYLRGIGKIANSVKLLLDCEMLISKETEIKIIIEE